MDKVFENLDALSKCTYKGFTQKEFLTVRLGWGEIKEINEATEPRISVHMCLKAGDGPPVCLTLKFFHCVLFHI